MSQGKFNIPNRNANNYSVNSSLAKIFPPPPRPPTKQ